MGDMDIQLKLCFGNFDWKRMFKVNTPRENIVASYCLNMHTTEISLFTNICVYINSFLSPVNAQGVCVDTQVQTQLPCLTVKLYRKLQVLCLCIYNKNLELGYKVRIFN